MLCTESWFHQGRSSPSLGLHVQSYHTGQFQHPGNQANRHTSALYRWQRAEDLHRPNPALPSWTSAGPQTHQPAGNFWPSHPGVNSTRVGLRAVFPQLCGSPGTQQAPPLRAGFLTDGQCTPRDGWTWGQADLNQTGRHRALSLGRGNWCLILASSQSRESLYIIRTFSHETMNLEDPCNGFASSAHSTVREQSPERESDLTKLPSRPGRQAAGVGTRICTQESETPGPHPAPTARSDPMHVSAPLNIAHLQAGPGQAGTLPTKRCWWKGALRLRGRAWEQSSEWGAPVPHSHPAAAQVTHSGLWTEKPGPASCLCTLTFQPPRASPRSQAPHPFSGGAGFAILGMPTDLVGKEQVAHGVVVRVLHDGPDHLQHRGDACKTAAPPTGQVSACCIHRPCARQAPRGELSPGRKPGMGS